MQTTQTTWIDPDRDLDAVGGTPYVPTFAAGNSDRPTTRVEASAPFLLLAHHERWTVMGGRVIPAFSKMRLRPGVNGVESVARQDGTVSIKAGTAKTQWEEWGWTVIPVDAVPPAHVKPGQPRSYLWQPEGRPDATMLMYERCYPGSAQMTTDVPRYLEFCAYLEERGIVRPPPIYYLQKMLADATARRDQYTRLIHKSPRFEAMANAANDEIQAIEATLERRRGDVMQTPVEAGAAVVPDVA